MSSALSRRQLAEYASDQILAGQPIEKISARLAAVLCETKRTKEAELLARDIAYELETRGKVANANITSASNISDELRDQIIKFIKETAKVDKVTLDENVDKSVLGGVRIETAVHAWDKTISKKLADIRESF
jgi:F0F1-type ATP synthase delta subunit